MNFDEWIILIDAAQNQTQAIQEKIAKLEGREPTPGELSAIEALCRRFLDTIPPPISHTRPRDVMAYEWNADPYAILRSRLHTLQAAAKERSSNVSLWINELRVGLDDFIEGWEWFNSRIER